MVGDLERDDAATAAMMPRVLLDRRAFARAELGQRHQLVARRGDLHADAGRVFRQLNTPHAAAGTRCGAQLRNRESHRLAIRRHEHDVVIVVRQLGRHEDIVLLQVHSDQA